MRHISNRRRPDVEDELIVDDDGACFYDDEDEDWEGCCEDPIELTEEDILNQGADRTDQRSALRK